MCLIFLYHVHSASYCQVPDGNWKDVRPYLELAHFNPDVIRTKNSAAAGLCGWGKEALLWY